MRKLLVSLVATLVVGSIAGCGGDEGGALKKKVDQLERRVDALERGGRRGAGKREGKGGAVAEIAGPKGKVEVTGDAGRVALLKDGTRFEVPGEVPVGSYKILARFGEDKVEAGTLDVAEGETVSLSCTSATKTCAKP